MEESRPWKYDPVAFGVFALLEMTLRRSGETLNEDLLARSRAAAEKSKAGAQTPVTTLRRVSWCCYVASDMLLLGLSLAAPDVRPEDRRVVDARQLEAMDSAIKGIEDAVHIECAEYKMEDSARQRGAEQNYADMLNRRLRVLFALRAMYAEAKSFCRSQNKDAAKEVGSLFMTFLTEHGSTRDEMVAAAERFAEVQRG